MKKPRLANGTAQRWLEAHAAHVGEDCLLWPFSCSTPGYGQFMPKGSGRVRMAHRYMCELVHGEPPSAAHVAAHSCGNRKCVNPSHLSWKSLADNQLDRHVQGRPFKGRARSLTPADVLEIRRMKGEKTSVYLAKHFGCTESNIRHVQSGTTYKHITDSAFEQTTPEEKSCQLDKCHCAELMYNSLRPHGCKHYR